MPTLAKFAPPLNNSYSEIPQPNPLKWELYFLEEDVLYPQTSQFRCKDFFNEVVAWYFGKPYSIYRFDTNKMKFNTYGVFVRLYNIQPGFVENINKHLQPLLPEGVDPLMFVPLEKEDELLTLIPRALFNSTYTISKLTKIIRLCNQDEVCDSFEKLAEVGKEELYPAEFAGGRLLPNEPFNIYWWYATDEYNSNAKSAGEGVIHDNGYIAFGRGSLGKA